MSECLTNRGYGDGVVSKAHGDVWPVRVTLSDGRVYVCCEIRTQPNGWWTLVPTGEFFREEDFWPPDGRRVWKLSREMDVNPAFVVSVEDCES